MEKAKVVFVDDDPKELDEFAQIFESDFEVLTIRWLGLFGLQDLAWLGHADVIVSDMYLPATDSDERISDGELEKQENEVRKIAEEFGELYPRFRSDAKRLLQETMKLLESARKRLLDAQWKAMGQSPGNGFALFRAIRQHESYKSKPVIFYSRKITVENAVDAMDEGARVVRKGELERLRAEIEDAIAKRQSL